MLRSGGRAALRSPDWGGFVVGPQSEGLDRAISAYRELQRRNGGDVFIGRQLGALLRAAGFRHVVATATYEISPSAALIGEYLAQRLEADGDAQSAGSLRGWLTDPDAISLRRGSRPWERDSGRGPDA